MVPFNTVDIFQQTRNVTYTIKIRRAAGSSVRLSTLENTLSITEPGAGPFQPLADTRAGSLSQGVRARRPVDVSGVGGTAVQGMEEGDRPE